MQTILVLPVWYPTEANPHAGSFFKEQIELLSENYNFIVLKYSRGSQFKDSKLYRLSKDREYQLDEDWGTITEYTATSHESKLSFIMERLASQVLARKCRRPGVGIYHTNKYRQIVSTIAMNIASDLAKEHDIDFVYGISAMGVAYESYSMAKFLEVPLLFSEHGPFPYPGTTIADTDQEALEACDEFLAISHDKVRQVLLTSTRLKSISYIGNLVDETKFNHKPLAHYHPTFLIVAANSFFKNYDLFIETMNRLTEKTTKDFRVIIAGYNANKAYDGDAAVLEKKVSKSAFADKVEMSGAIPREGMNDLYNRVDAFIMTSIQEGQPVSALEAGCCGLPIFSTRCGGVEDYVTPDIGRIVDLTDAETLSDHLRAFLEGEITFDGAHIRETIVSRFGRKAYGKAYEDIICSRQVTESAGSHRRHR